MKKRGLKKRVSLQESLEKQSQGYAISILALVIIIVLLASYGIMEITERKAHSAAEKLVSEAVEHIDAKMTEVEQATIEASLIAQEQLNNPSALEQLVRDFVEQNSFVYGSTVAFEPDIFPELGRCFAPYSWKSSEGEVHSRQLGTETDYYQEEWYAETKLSGKEYWCEPYFDEGGAKVMMCTFSVPLKDEDGKLVAVMTADVGIEDLNNYVSSISPYPDSYVVLRSRAGNALANAELDSTIGNNNIIIKGLTDIGWSVELVMPFTYLMHGNSGVFLYIGIIFLITILFVYFSNRVITKMQQRSSSEYLSVINAVSSGFTSIHLVNLLTNEAFALRNSENIEKNKDKLKDLGNNFTEIMARLIESDVYTSDREMMLREIQPEVISRNLTGHDRYEVLFRKKEEGEICWYEMHVFFLERGNNGEPVSAVVAFADVNESILKEKENQDILQKALEMADSANQAKSSFLFNMSHDIRTPLNAIRGFTTMAKKNASNEKTVSEYLDKIDISGQQLLTLINQVLEMARIESGKIVFDEKPVNVRKEFNSMVTVLSEQALTKGLKFNYEINNIEHNYILADEAKMGSITLNIIGNAIKYTPEGGSVEYVLNEIPARKPGYATFVFKVSDTGIGMSKEYLKEIFEPFSRENNTTVSRIQGTGLGMSIVKNTVDHMGGDIKVQSEPGKGTQFEITVDFKIDENAENVSEESDDVTEHISFNGRRVLLVEDNEMNREIARDILEEQGLIVEDADDGDVAVEMVRAVIDRGAFHYYDFILMDVQMPRMNGYEATREIRSISGPDGVHIPIIAMTANAFEEDRQNALAAGMDEHLTKPIDIQKMFRTIAKFLK